MLPVAPRLLQIYSTHSRYVPSPTFDTPWISIGIFSLQMRCRVWSLFRSPPLPVGGSSCDHHLDPVLSEAGQLIFRIQHRWTSHGSIPIRWTNGGSWIQHLFQAYEPPDPNALKLQHIGYLQWIPSVLQSHYNLSLLISFLKKVNRPADPANYKK